MIVFVKSSVGVVEAEARLRGAAVLPPNGTAWLSATFRVPWRARVGWQCSSALATGRTGGRTRCNWRDSLI